PGGGRVREPEDARAPVARAERVAELELLVDRDRPTTPGERPCGGKPHHARPDNRRLLSHGRIVPSTEGRGDAVPQDPDPIDLELDVIAPLQPAGAAVLEDAAGADGARAEHIA